MKSVMCFLTIVVSLFVFAQLPAVSDVSGLVSGRKAPAFPVAVLQPAPFEFRGIRIGDEIKEAERRLLSWKLPSLSSKPGLCGSDGINRIPDRAGRPEKGSGSRGLDTGTQAEVRGNWAAAR